MTALPATHDSDSYSYSYSTRTCRCGKPMLRLVEPVRAGWVCPACGRRAKR